MPFSIAALVLADENGENFQSYSSFWQLWCVGTVAPSTDVIQVAFSTGRGAAALSADLS
jgi:hypothetical protein